jgi:hypothetical protein
MEEDGLAVADLVRGSAGLEATSFKSARWR